MFTFTAIEPPSNLVDESATGTDKNGSDNGLLENIYQSVIRFDPDISIIVDLGWNADLSLDLQYLVDQVKNADLILLSHATIAHLGAYAYLYKIVNELAAIPVYATPPVIALGRILTLDIYRSAGLVGPFEGSLLTMADVDLAFDHIHPLKYQQPTSLTAKLHGVGICAFNSGHSLGGTIWKITRDQESIVYAVSWNHSKDALHNGSLVQQNGEVIEPLTNVDAVISSTRLGASGSLRKRRELFFEKLGKCFEKNAPIIIPTSNGSRALELGYVLDNYWQENNIQVPLYFLSYTGARSVSYATTMIEWMSSAVIGCWEQQNKIPFGYSNLKFACSLDDLPKEGPCVILASGESLDLGFSRLLFAELCGDSNTTLMLTEHTGKNSLADRLFRMFVQRSEQAQTRFNIEFYKEVPLSGEELDEYNRLQSEQRRREELQNAIDMRNKNILEQEESESSEDEEETDEMIRSGKVDLGALAYGEVYDYDLRSETKKGKNRMFPYYIKRKRADEYGQIIRFEDFSKVMEPDDGNEFNAGVDEARVGEKRKWQIENNKTSSGGVNGESAVASVTRATKAKDVDDNIEDAEAIAYNPGVLEANNAAQLGVTIYNQPTRLEKRQQEIVVNCEIEFLDFEGLTDETSIKMILPKMKAGKLFLLPSSSLQESDLIDTLESIGQAFEVVKPNEPVTTGANTYSFNVTISPELARLLKWQKVFGNVNVAHVTGKLQIEEHQIRDEQGEASRLIGEGGDIQKHEEEHERKELKSEEADVKMETTADGSVETTIEEKMEFKSKRIHTLVPLQTVQELALAPRTGQLFVGDIKLAELKKRLIAEGHRAEFRAEGILVCDDKVAIRKTAEGRISVEGGIGREFYETKRIIRSLLAVV